MAYGKLKVDTITYDNGGTEVDVQVSALAGAGSVAPINDPDFTGTPTAPTPDSASNDTSLATTAFVVSKDTDTLTSAQNYTDTVVGAGNTWTAAPTLTGSSLTYSGGVKRFTTDTSGGAINVELPRTDNYSAAAGDQIVFIDSTGTWNTNNFTIIVDPMSSDKILGGNSLVCNVQHAMVTLIYTGVASVGWIVK
tara:strand:+ start:3701 stop:4282 length:582 start_codon:yes stop_codon:yes gene_type:complete